MKSNPEGQTSKSLLERLRQGSDQTAWTEFVHRYGQQIYRWCRAFGLQEADAEDVTQTVLVKLTDKLRAFCYDPSRSFRAYLKTLTHYAWCDFLELHNRPGAGTGDSAMVQTLQTVQARDDLVQLLNAEFDQELLDVETEPGQGAGREIGRRVEDHHRPAGALRRDQRRREQADFADAGMRQQQLAQDPARPAAARQLGVERGETARYRMRRTAPQLVAEPERRMQGFRGPARRHRRPPERR